MLFSGMLRVAVGRTSGGAKLLSLSSVRLIPCGVRSNIQDKRSAIGNPSTSTITTRRTARSEEHTSELQSRFDLVCRLLLEKKKRENKLNKFTYPQYRHQYY